MENAAIGKNKNLIPQEALGQSKKYKFTNWTKTKAWPWIKKTGDQIIKAGEAIGKRLLKIRISWLSILVIVILANMAKDGALDDMPQLKWIIESSMRLIEWLLGLIHNILKGVVDLPVPRFGIFEMFDNWVRQIFAL